MRQDDSPPSSETVAADIRARRGSDTIVEFSTAPESEASDSVLLDTFAQQIGLHPIGMQWRNVSREEAAALAVSGLTHDLAYNVRLMEAAEAERLVDRLLSLFDGTGRFFTNRGKLGDWIPLTESTFDLGVFAVDRRWLGAFVVQDED